MNNKNMFFNNANLNFSIFRIGFAILMIPQIYHLFPFVYDLQNSSIVIHYPFLDFIEAYSILFLKVLEVTAYFSVLLIIQGKYLKIGAFLFLVTFGYVFLIDISFYNNHYYLWCLICILFIISDADKSLTLKELVIKKNYDRIISLTTILSFKILITIVYFYAAVAKMNTDWLQAYPPILWFQERGFHYYKELGFAMAYSGLVYDLFVPVGLWFFIRKWWFLVIYISFHVLNYFTFNIGIFPVVMILVLILFVPKNNSFPALSKLRRTFSLKHFLIIVFILFNVLFPLRFLLIDGNVAIHRQGYSFSWRMMLNKYELKELEYLVVIESKKIKYKVSFEKLMTFRQFSHTYNSPYAIWYVAQKLKRDAQNKYKADIVKVYCNTAYRLNQHDTFSVIESNINLAEIKYSSFFTNNFISK